MSSKYEEAGVSLESGYQSIERIKKHIESTKSKGFNGDIGGFGGLFELFRYTYEEPILVSGTDGVGTKLLLAIEHDILETIGIDLVAMCVNDILTSGAQPLFFLDYIAVEKNYPSRIERIVAGIAEGCNKGHLSLIGGETAEMPGLYEKDHFDLAGFAVGVVERSKQINGESLKEGDVLIGIPSSGIHSNGYSLVRKIIDDAHLDMTQKVGPSSLIEALLEPTRIYVDEIMALKHEIDIKAMSHITGGGYYENLPRMISQKSLGIELDLSQVIVPEIFSILMKEGSITEDEMYHIFNMGIGFVVVVSPEDQERSLKLLREFHPNSCVIGHISAHEGLKIV
jgi:phosphoribosylformylglycinamidine cyclo-ligase